LTSGTGRLKLLFSLLAFRLFVGGVVTVYVPYSIISSHPERSLPLPGPLAVAGGLMMIAVGTVVFMLCVWDFVFDGHGMAPKVLVARGMYKLVRNPMYAALVAILLGEALFFRSWRLLGFAAVFWLGLHLLVTLYEERALTKEFGGSYAQYRKEVGRWFPKAHRH
jgi:protein-S-isoprenylcysteine O-methyltransferase Ste14